MKKTILLIATFCCMLPLMAQSEGEQVLVFRNTGEVNLFYSDRLDSVICSPIDADSVLHSEPVSQIFYSKDTTMLIPLAEIDSVAFGERNEMEFKEDVRELAETDISWIIRTEDNSIYYQTDTPQDVLPAVGQKLFCGFDGSEEQANLFPYGLSAKVVSVVPSSNEICVTVENIELDEIFSKFFFAGKLDEQYLVKGKRKTSSVKDGLTLESTIPLGDMGEIGVSGNVNLDYNRDLMVISPLTHYYHVEVDADYGFGFNVSLKSEDSGDADFEEIFQRSNLCSFYKVLNLRAAWGAFADVSAELTVGFEMERTYHRRIIWTQQNKENSFEVRNTAGDNAEPYEDTATLDLTLEGNIYFGPVFHLDFYLIGDVLGARAKVKIGPEFDGNISLGMVREMHEYNPQFYGNAELHACNKFAVEGYTTNRQYIMWGEVTEHKIFEISERFAHHSIQLFPNYTETRGTQVTTQQVAEVSVATKSDGEIAHEVETGFELVDEQTQEIIDSTYVGVIEANSEEVQGLSTEFEVPAQEERQLMVRPVFHYAGYVVSAAPAHVQKGFQIQPIIFSGSNGAVAYAASYPFRGEVTGGGTNYRAGAYLPIAVRDTVFQKGPTVIDHIDVINYNQEEELVGIWSGTEGGTDVTYTFNDDGTGSLNNDVFTYELNTPQSGQIRIMFEDKNKSSIILTILRLSEGIIQYRRAKDNNIYTLTKKN